MEQARLVLEKRLRHGSFRQGHRHVIHRLLVDGKNVLFIAPASEDRVLVFQVPALCLEGLTLVVSPLLSLMKEQVHALKERQVEAASIGSDSSVEDLDETWSKARNGALKVLYITPERLTNEGFRSRIAEQNIALLVIEEAQTVFDSARSFRPDYGKLPQFASAIAAERILCLASTATPAAIREICAPSPDGFEIDTERGVFRSGSNRENVSIIVHQAYYLSNKKQFLMDCLNKLDGGSAIIYVTTPNHVVSRTQELRDNGFVEVMFCHGQMTRQEKDSVRDKFNAEGGIVVANKAFGMGVYRQDIRAIIHFDPPTTLETYSEQIATVGRDGEPAECLLLHTPRDYEFLRDLVSHDSLNQNAIEQWLQAVFTSEVDPNDNTLCFSLAEQAIEFGIEKNVLSILYDKLGADFGFLSVTPFYSTYKIKPLPSEPQAFRSIMEDSSDAAEAIRLTWKQLAPYSRFEVDVLAAASAKGLLRHDISTKLRKWADQNWCEIEVGAVVNCYLPPDPLRKSSQEITDISRRLWNAVSLQIGSDQERLDKVKAFTTSAPSDCFGQRLAKHFGDPNPAKCGKCSFCDRSRGIWAPPSPSGSPRKRAFWIPDGSPTKKARCAPTAPRAKSESTE